MQQHDIHKKNGWSKQLKEGKKGLPRTSNVLSIFKHTSASKQALSGAKLLFHTIQHVSHQGVARDALYTSTSIRLHINFLPFCIDHEKETKKCTNNSIFIKSVDRGIAFRFLIIDCAVILLTDWSSCAILLSVHFLLVTELLYLFI